MTVAFLPSATTWYDEDLTIGTAAAGTFSFQLTGRGVSPVAQWTASRSSFDYGLVDIAEGATTTVTFHNTGNVPVVVDDYDISNAAFSASHDIFTLAVDESVTVTLSFDPDAVATFNGTFNWASNAGTAEVIVSGKGFRLSESPVLTYDAYEDYGGEHGVYPRLGSPDTFYEYRVVYTDPDGNPPMAGYPKILLDLSGDGDALDPNEGAFTMEEADDTDFNFADGKLYSLILNLPLDKKPGYDFLAYDALGNPAIGQATTYVRGPTVTDDLLDLSIYASDITFSNQHPLPGEVITITANVHNRSDFPAENVSVKFYEEDLFLREWVVPRLSPQSSTSITIEHVFTVDQFYPIKVVLDEANTVNEDNELNNFAIRPVLVGEFAVPGEIESSAALNTATVYPYGTVRLYGRADYVNSFDVNPKKHTGM